MSVDHYLKFLDGKLVSGVDAISPPSQGALFVHSQFRAMILNNQFPCPGARTTFQQGTYRFGFFDEIGTQETARALGESLKKFVEERPSWDTMYTGFISCYKEPIPLTHQQFADLLWSMLQELHATDIAQWDPKASSDVESPDFSFSYGGLSFFIAGMHSGSPRFARRFAWPTLVFNAHEQFDFLREKGIFEKFRDKVRKNDTDLQGCVNPASADFGSQSEAIQYTGLIKNETWKCPFKHKTQEK